MQYQVPQFIEIEDKIFGPLTFKQFLYVAGGCALGFIIWSFIPSFIALPLGGGVVAFFMMAAFYKVNGRPFLHFIENFFQYTFSKKLYLWKKRDKKPQKGKRVETQKAEIRLPKLSESKLKELSWGLDIHEKIVNPAAVKDQK
jgi:hypothetical protein